MKNPLLKRLVEKVLCLEYVLLRKLNDYKEKIDQNI
jgi:hypothetical protein